MNASGDGEGDGGKEESEGRSRAPQSVVVFRFRGGSKALYASPLSEKESMQRVSRWVRGTEERGSFLLSMGFGEQLTMLNLREVETISAEPYDPSPGGPDVSPAGKDEGTP